MERFFSPLGQLSYSQPSVPTDAAFLIPWYKARTTNQGKHSKGNFDSNVKNDLNISEVLKMSRDQYNILRAHHISNTLNEVLVSNLQRNSSSANDNQNHQLSTSWVEDIDRVREDYYCTLIAACDSWSLYPMRHSTDVDSEKLRTWLMTDSVATVSISEINLWSKQCQRSNILKLRPPPGNCYYGTAYEINSVCLSKSLFTVCTTHGGRIIMKCMITGNTYQELLYQLIDKYNSKNGDSIFIDSNNPQAVHSTSVVWLPRKVEASQDMHSRFGLSSEFIVGDNYGRVFVISLTKSYELNITAFGSISSQPIENPICSLSLSIGVKYLSSSMVDNRISIWQFSAGKCLKLAKVITLPSVVRGLAFCPACDLILATGGGRADRTFRLLCVKTKKILKEVIMPAQIVGVVWVSQSEVFIALGHSRVNGFRGYGKIYNILTDRVVAELPGEAYSLTAVKTMSGVCINTSNDQLVHFTWNTATKTIKCSLENEIVYNTSKLEIPSFR